MRIHTFCYSSLAIFCCFHGDQFPGEPGKSHQRAEPMGFLELRQTLDVFLKGLDVVVIFYHFFLNTLYFNHRNVSSRILRVLAIRFLETVLDSFMILFLFFLNHYSSNNRPSNVFVWVSHSRIPGWHTSSNICFMSAACLRNAIVSLNKNIFFSRHF